MALGNQNEFMRIFVRIIYYLLIIFIAYLFYKFYFKKESKIAKPAKIFAWIFGIFFLLIGILSLFFLLITLFVPNVPISSTIIILFIVGIVIFGSLGIMLILIAIGKWKPKHLK